MSKNELIVSDENSKLVAEMSGQNVTMFTSMKAETVAEKAAFFNATATPDERVSEMVGKTIKVKDLFVQMVELTNEETGEVATAPRIVLIDVDGKSYQAVSVGIFSALKNLIGIFGPPTWEEGIPIEIKQIRKGKNLILTFSVKA